MLAVQNSPLKYEKPGEESAVAICTQTLQIPKLFDEQDRQRFAWICGVTYRIFEKAIAAWKQDEEVRALFGFGPALSRLIERTPAYKAAIPILRVDIFYNEETKEFQFCEFNTDGTSAMFENDTMAEFLIHNNAWQQLHLNAQIMPLMEPWADAFLEDFEQARPGELPSIVITDFLEDAYLPELYAFEALFQKRGIPARVVDIRNLHFENGELIDPSDGMAFNAIYRRAVTHDIEEHLDQISDFLAAVEQDAAVLIGDFQTQIPHSKMISEALMHPALQKYLDADEIAFLNAHLPATQDLTGENWREFLSPKEKWIIKPQDGYAARGVWAGVDVSQQQWERLLEDNAGKQTIVQRYIPHYRTLNADLIHDEGFEPYANLTGLYVYNGQFAGVYSRLSKAGIVSTQYNERMVPTAFLTEEQEMPEDQVQEN